MSLKIDESTLTAYVLGELAEAQMAEMKWRIEQDRELQRIVAEIEESVGLVQAGFERERMTFGRSPRPPRWWSNAAIGIAASVVGGGMLAAAVVTRTERRTVLAENMTAAPHVPVSTTSMTVVDQKVAGLIKDARLQIAQSQYEKALTTIDKILAAQPNNQYAAGVRPLVEDRAHLQSQHQFREQFDREFSRQINSAEGQAAPNDVIKLHDSTKPDFSVMADVNTAIASNQTGLEHFVAPASQAEHEDAAVAMQASRESGALAVSSNTTLQTALDRKLPEVRFDAVGLSDTMDFLSDVTGAKIIVKTKALASAGIAENAPVTLRLHDLKFSTVLTQVLDEVGGRGVKLGYAVNGDVITISTADDLAAGANTEAYSRIEENPFLNVAQNPLSTFSVDVDTASYSNIRRFIDSGQLPPKDAVRIEEMVNYFPCHYAPPTNDDAFATSIESADCPWASGHRLVRIGIKGREISAENRPPMSLTFLIDVSGSMFEPNKLPLVKQSLKMLIEKLRPIDRVGIVVYAGNTGLVLPSTPAGERELILSKIEGLEAGGSTNGAAGIELAYQTAQSAFIKNGVNRVILCTDGDWNVGVTSEGNLTRLIETKAKSGVFLSVLGFGMGNVKDSMMVKLADKGNGNYGYVDTEREARKLLVDQMSGTLVTIAKDVKIQVEFNPAKVSSYRLIGYEKRMLAKEDFNDDRKDAGEIGAGHTVTALYEITPPGADATRPAVDPLKYQGQDAEPRLYDNAAQSNEMLTVKVRYKQPDGDVSKKLEFPFKDDGKDFAHASKDMQFAAGVAEFAMVLRDSQYKGMSSVGAALEIAQSTAGDDTYRKEFVDLVKKAGTLMPHQTP